MRPSQFDELARRIVRQFFGEALREFADGGVNERAALGGAGFGADRIERGEPQDVLGVDRIGIAQPVLDLGHRKAFRPCRARRFRRRLRLRRNCLGPVELARPGEIIVATVARVFPALAGDRGEALDEARRHGRRAGDLGGVSQDHVAGAEQLREIVGGKADAAFRQIEAELEPHRAAEPGIGPALRRPGAFDQAAEHNAVAIGKARFERSEDAHSRPVLQWPPHYAVTECGRKQFEIVGRLDEQARCSLARRQFVKRVGEFCAVRPGECDFVCALPRQLGQHGAMAGGKIAERLRPAVKTFERLKRVAESRHEIGGGGEFGIGQCAARIGWMQTILGLAKCF